MTREYRKGGQARGQVCRRCGADDWEMADKYKCRPCRREQRRRWDSANPKRKMWLSARARAARLGLEFSITIDDINRVWPADGRCPALGITLQRCPGNQGDTSPSLDRLKPELGYVVGNIAVLSQKANQIKNNGQLAELEQIVDWMRAQGLE